MSAGGSAALATLVCGMVHAPEKKTDGHNCLSDFLGAKGQ